MKYFTIMLVLTGITLLQFLADVSFYLLVSETATNCLRQGKFIQFIHLGKLIYLFSVILYVTKH